MAEVAGLILGVIGVAGVIGAFKDTVDLFNIIADSRQLGRDYEILETKFDIEKTLLLQWANRIRLLSPDYDKRLDNPEIQRLLVRILECVAGILTNAPELTQRYGLDEAPKKTVIAGEERELIPRTPRVSDSRWNKFLAEYLALRSQDKVPKRPTPLFKKARWLIRDKQKFEDLIRELSHFRARINEVCPVTMVDLDRDRDLVTRAMADQDVDTIKDLRKLKILKEASAGSQNSIVESTQHAISEACKDRILRKLWFRRIDDRRENIVTAHSRTLRWALKPRREDAPWDDLSAWLQSGSGIYWISGKAGSGKSTLMKHLWLEERVRDLLSQWARGRSYYLCNFFFMNLGTIEQKSQEGLSRTLLFQVLSAHRDLIPDALPYMWREIHDIQTNNTEDDIELPSQAESRHAFSVIAKKCSSIGRFCFLIDGLDEFVGDHMEDCIDFINSLAANEHIKIVVSSRPISVCVAAFTNRPNLQLQDLNRGDIASYVNDVVGSHNYMEKLIRRHGNEGKLVLDEVIDKSSGVFLWVVLACRSLLSGFMDYDNISELRRRVRELPPELDDMFQHMLGKINRRYRQECSRLLQVCYAQQIAPWPGAVRDMYALGLALVIDYHSSPRTFWRFTDDEKQEACIDLEGRLRSRCGGLLEVTGFGYSPHRLRSMTVENREYMYAQVQFMNRTVFEFLNIKETWDLECLRVPPDDIFDVNTALSLYGLHLAIESLHSVWPSERQASSFLWQGLRWAILADAQSRGDSGIFFANLPEFLCSPELPKAAQQDESLEQLSLKATKLVTHPIWHLPLLVAIEAGAINYVRTHPDLQALAKHDRHMCGCWPVLCHAVRRMILSEDFQTTNRSRVDGGHFSSRDMASLLLQSGFNPNDSIPATMLTPWILWLQDQELKVSDLSDLGKMEVLLFAEVFLQGGANPTPGHFALAGFLDRKLLSKNSSEQVREKSRAVQLLIQESRERRATPPVVPKIVTPATFESKPSHPRPVFEIGDAISKQKTKSHLLSNTKAQLSARMDAIAKRWRSKDS